MEFVVKLYIYLVLGQGYWKVNGIGKYQSLWLRYWMSLRCEKSCDHCMTLRYVPSRDDNRLIGQSTVICTGRQIGDCDHWSTDWRLWPAVFWLETGTAPFLIGDRLGFPSHGVTREGNCPLTFERGTVSTHLEYIYIELECSASGMAWVEHQGLYMRVSREMGFEKGMNENFSKESMNWGLDGEVYRCGIWLRGWEWFLKSSKDGLDLFWMWQRAWNDKWMEDWFSYIYIVILNLWYPLDAFTTAHLTVIVS